MGNLLVTFRRNRPLSTFLSVLLTVAMVLQGLGLDGIARAYAEEAQDVGAVVYDEPAEEAAPEEVDGQDDPAAPAEAATEEAAPAEAAPAPEPESEPEEAPAEAAPAPEPEEAPESEPEAEPQVTTDEAQEPVATFSTDEDEKLVAYRVEGEAVDDEEVAADALEQLPELDEEMAKKAAGELFAPRALTAEPSDPDYIGPVADDEYERSLDGSNIETIAARWVTEDTVDNDRQTRLYVKPDADEEQTVVLGINYALSGEFNYAPGTVTITIPAHIFKNASGKDYGTISIPFPQEPKDTKDFNWQRIGDEYVLTNTKYFEAATTGYFEISWSEMIPHELVDMLESEPFQARIEVTTNKGNTIALKSNELTAQFDTEAKVKDLTKHVQGSAQRVAASEIPEDQRIDGEEEYIVVNWYLWGVTEANTVYTLDLLDSIPQDQVVGDTYDKEGATEADAHGFIVKKSLGSGATLSEQDTILERKGIYRGYRDGIGQYYYYKTAYPASQFKPDTLYTFHNDVKYTVTERDPEVTDPVNPNVNDGKPDPQLVTTAKASATTTYQWSEPEWVDPPGHFYIIKNGNDDKEQHGEATHNRTRRADRNNGNPISDLHIWYLRDPIHGWYGVYPSGINDLQDLYEEQGAEGSIRLGYTVDSIGYAMPWFFDSTSFDRDGAVASRMSKNYNLPVTITTYDEGLSIGRSKEDADGNNLGMLTPNVDYDFVSVEFPEAPYVYTGQPHNINPDGSWHAVTAGDGTFLYTRDNNRAQWPDFDLEVQLGGEWQHLATASWKSGKLQVTLADGTTQSDPVVDLPEGTENWRTIVTLHNTSTDEEANEALQAAIDYDVRVVVDFRSTDAVKALIDELFSQTNTPSMEVWNKAELVATDSEGDYIIKPNELDDDGYDRVDGYTTDTMVYPKKEAKYTSKDVNYDDGYVTVHYKAQVEEQSLIHDKVAYEQAVKDGRLVTETKGVWYDLLPKGMVPDLDTVKLRDGDNITYKGIVSDNWNGTGRILMKVEADLTPHTEQVRMGDTYTYSDTPTLTFDARMTFEAINDYGKKVHNVVAFESGNDTIGTIPKYRGEPDDPRYVEEGQTDAQGNPVGGNIATSRAFADDAERDAFTDLDDDRDTPSFVYAGTYTTLNVLSQARTSLSKEVSVNGDGYWNTGTYYMKDRETLDDVLEAPEGNKRTVYEGGQYAYRLRMTSDNSTISSNLVLYDSLEDFYAGGYTGGEPNDEIDLDAPHWRGTLTSVDTSQLKGKGCAPVVYYTTYKDGDRRLQISDESDPTQVIENTDATNLENSDVWVRADQYTGSLADVTGVAIDCRKRADGSDFELQPLESVTAIIRMQAPSGEEARAICENAGEWGKSAQAYNNCYLKCDQTDKETGVTDEGKFIRKDYTKVGMVEYEYEVEKRWDDEDDNDGIRPESVTINLLRNGKPALDDDGNPITATVTPDENGKWSYTFEHLPRTDPDGNKYAYSAAEEPVTGYTSSSSATDDKIIITNKHVLETTRVDGKKLWSGDTEDARPASVTVSLLADGEAKKSQTVTPDKDGNWSYSFEDLPKYRDHGTEIEYTVEEVVTDTAGRSYTNEVTGSAAEGYTITNTYHPYGELYVSKAVKDVTDVSKEQEFTFTFEFTRDVGNEEQPVTATYDYDVLDENDQVVSSGTIATNGTISIKGGQTIHVKEMDEYIKYEVSEAKEAGFTLTASEGLTGTIKPNEASQASLTNTYRASGSLSPKVTKTLTDKAPKRREFSYTIYRVDGGEETYVGTGYNDKPTEVVERDDGTTEYTVAPVRFGSLEYTQADAGKTYHYVIRENIPDEATNEAGQDYATYHGTIGVSGPWTCKGVTYDETEYLLDVSVEDNGDGTLAVTPTYKKDGPLIFDEEVDEASFRNEYKAEGEVELKAWKDLKGRKPAEGEFTFELLGDEVDEQTGASKVIQTKTNDADGEVTFDKIAFDQTSIGKTLHYYVREVKGSDPTLTYDENVYGYTIIVYDNGDGTLSFSSTRCGVKVTEVPIEGEFSFRTIEADGTHNGWNHVGRRIGNFHRKYLQGRYWAKWITNNPEATAEFNAIWENDVNGVTVRSGTLGSDENVKNAMERAYRHLWDTSTARFRVGDVLVYDSGYTAGFSGYIPIRTYLNDGGRTYHTWLIGVDQAYDYLYEPEGMTENEPVVFTNELKPGGFTVTKLVTDAEGADPNQEFKFKVVLTGDVTDDTVTGYTLSEVEPSDQTALGTMSESDEADEGLLGKLGDLLSGSDADTAASLAKLNPFAPTKAFAAEGGTFNGMDWEITDDGTLILGKEGETQTLTMPTQPNERAYPWKSYSALVKTVRFDGDVKAIGDLNYMFSSMSALESVDLTGFDTSNATAMYVMFRDSSKLESIDLSGLDLSSCTGMSAMFQGTSSLKSVDLSGKSAPLMNGVGGMFQESGVVSVDMSGFDAPSLTSTAGMFYKAHNLESIDMSGFHAPNVTSMGSMFYECESLKSLDLSSFEIHLANTGMYRDFYNCSALESLDISGIDTADAANLTEIFLGCSSLSEVTLGTKFSFKGNGSASINSSKLPDPPVENPFTGNWIKVDGSSDPYTALQLAEEYNASLAGTWVWESDMYKVVFDANGGAGSMASRLYAIDRDATLPTNQFRRFGYNFTGWQDTDGNAYADKGTIPADTFAKDQEVTLTAQWEPVDTSVNMNNGEFEFTLHANEKATFDNIPAGVSYAVYEETPDGWVLVEQSNVSGTIPAADYANATFTNRYQPGTTTAQFNGVKLLDGVAAEKDAYTFELLENGEVIQTKATLDGGFVQFDVITYEKKDVGTHTYTIREVDPNDPTIDIDRHTETVTVEVTDDGKGNLSSKVTYDEDGIRFTNKTRPGNLRLTKVADGLTDANKDDEFTFEIELTNEKGMPLGSDDQVYWYVESAAADSGKKSGDASNGAQQPQDTQTPNAASLIPSSGLLSAGARALAGLFAPTKAYAAAPAAGKVRYAVAIYGIGQAKDESGAAVGLTFGPALGGNFVNSSSSHTPTGNTSKGNPHRCIHDDDWATITYWNAKDPNVYEQCIGSFDRWDSYTVGCTHGLDLNLSSTIANTSFVPTYTGDGPSVLLNEIKPDYRKWNSTASASGGWGSSKIRGVLNGGGGVSASDAIVSAMPRELQDVIASQEIKYDTTKEGTTTRTVYDKLWLLSAADLVDYSKISPVDISNYVAPHANEGVAAGVYTKFKNNSDADYGNTRSQYDKAANNKQREAYYVSSVNGGSGSSRKVRSWTRSIGPSRGAYGTFNNNVLVCITYDTGGRSASYDDAYGKLAGAYYTEREEGYDSRGGLIGHYANRDTIGISFGFSLLREDSHFGKVIYEPNGGVVERTSSVSLDGSPITLIGAQRPRYVFKGWNTKADGTGDPYSEGQSVTVDNDEVLVLYAQWERDNTRDYTVKHYQEKTTLDGFTLTETEKLIADKGAEVTPDTKEYEGFIAPEKQTVTVADDDSTVVEYYYKLKTYSVSFDGNGATSGYMDDQRFVAGYAAPLDANSFSKTGSIFTGWNTVADGSGTSYTDKQQVKDLATEPGETVTLYARWMDNPNEPLTPTAGKITVKCKAGETIVLPDLPAGTKYTITEVGLPGGWSQSGDVTNGNGTIAANTTAEATARNTYTARGTVQLEAHKALEGGDLKEGAFEFELVNKNGTVLQTKSNDAVDTAKTITNADGESVDNPWVGTAPVYFDAFQIDQSWIGQTHTYTIREKKVSDDKTITYDEHKETVTIEFYDAGHGQMAGKVTYDDDGALFENKVNTTGLKIEKKIEAPEDLTDTKFDFTVTLKGADGEELEGKYDMVVTRADGSEEEATIASGGTVSLAGGETAEISGLPIGGSYEVVETPAEGWETAAEGDTGTLEAEKVAEATFTNTWDENQPAKGTAKIVAHKTLKGGTISKDDEFTFQLLGPDGSVIQQKTVDKTGEAESDITFDPISYTDADANKTYMYRVREIAGKDGSVKYDSTNHTVLVSVGPNTGNGLLATDVRYAKYDSEGTVQESTTTGSASDGDLKIEAELIGDVPESGFAPGDTVSFLVTATNTGTEAEGHALKDIKATFSHGEPDYTKNGLAATKSEQFGVDHVVTAADVVSGKVSETITVEATGPNGKVSCEVTLTVGTETWTEVTENPATFVNEVSRTRIEGIKEWNDNGSASARPASVTVKLLQDGIVVETTTTTADEDWAWSFENLAATDAQGNEIEYTVAESNVEGYSSTVDKNDDGTWTITNTPLTDVDITKVWVDSDDADEMRPSAEDFASMVHLYAGDSEVTDVEPTVTDNGDNTYTATWSKLPKYDRQGAEIVYTVTEDTVRGYDSDAEGAVEPGTTITNTRKKVTPTSGTVEVTKTLAGRDWKDGDEFTFEIKADKSNRTDAMPAEKTVTVTKGDEGHKKSFGEIKFAKAGTYKYVVTEAKGSLGGVAYDGSEHVVTFEVVEDEDGNLLAKEGTELAQSVTFENTYSSKGSYQLGATKVLVDSEDLQDGQFEFTCVQVADAEGTALEGAEPETVANKADGTVTFSKHKLALSDFEDAEAAEDGSRTITRHYAISEVIPEGAEQDGDNWVVRTYGDDGALVKSVTYDGRTHIVTVTATEDGSGTIATTVDKAAGDVVFKNEVERRTPGKTHATPVAKKRLTNSKGKVIKLKGGEYTFELVLDGEVVETAKNTASGTVKFGTLEYDAEDAGKTFEYEIREVIPEGAKSDGKGNYTKGDITYDGHVEKMAVTVTASEDGTTLTASTTYESEDGAEFTNVKKEKSKGKKRKPTPKPQPKRRSLARTGDLASPFLPQLTMLGSALLSGGLVLRRRRKRR